MNNVYTFAKKRKNKKMHVVRELDHRHDVNELHRSLVNLRAQLHILSSWDFRIIFIYRYLIKARQKKRRKNGRTHK